MKKIISLMALAAVFAFAGPVSYYGKLQAKNGQLYGSKTGNSTPVQLKGMSMYWDYWDAGSAFYTTSVVNALVEKWNVEIIRVAHGTSGEPGAGDYNNSRTRDDVVIQAAIDKDIYVIIDYHAHYANNEVDEAKSFFEYMAKKWGSYPNVIFEVWNEPKNEGMWTTIKGYAEQVIPTIRNNGGTDNLVVVGTSQYSLHPEEAINNKVTDSGNNTAYTFHFYANSHNLNGGEYSGYSSYKQRINSAMQAGLTVFVTEWGVGTSDGQGVNNTTDAAAWMEFLDSKKISWCNWSVSNKDEAASAFRNQSNYTDPSAWQESGYSTSGAFAYNQLKSHAATAVWRTGAVNSSSSGEAQASEFIDDFEDLDGVANSGGVWYAYTDKGNPGDENGNGASTITNAENEEGDGYVVVVEGDNSTEGMAALTGIVLNAGTYKYDPYVALGLNLTEDEGIYDLSGCTKFTYEYKGAAHIFKAQTPEVKDYNYHTTSFIASTSWKTASVEWGDLAQGNWGAKSPTVTLDHSKIDKFAWEVQDVTGANYLYIDNFRCVDGEITASGSGTGSSSNSSTNPSSASSSGSTTTAGTSVFDDFDDGNATAENVAEDAYWYIYTAGGSVTNTQDATQTWDMISADGTNSYASMKGISGITSGDTTYPSVGVGVDFGMGALANCTAISYKYKGSGHHLRGLVDGVTKDKGYEHVAPNQDASSGWTTVTVTTMAQPDWVAGASPSDVKAFSWATVKGLAWVVDEKLTQANIGTQLDIDDVECVGGTIQPTASSASSATSSGSGSSTVVSGGAETFDDFDDGNTVAENIADDAYWYLYKAGGTLTNTQDANQTWDMIVSEGTNSYAAMKGIGGITSGSTDYPSVGMGVDFGAGVLAQCTAIQYDYKGSGHHLRGLVDGVTKDKGYEHVAPNQNASSGWTTVTVSVMTQPDWVASASPSDVKAFSWAGVKGLAWVVDEKLTQANIGTELDIDNVKCVGKLSAGSSSNGNGTNGNGTNGNGTNGNGTNGNGTNGNGTNGNGTNGNGTGTNPYANTAIGVVAAPAGLSASIHGNTLQVTVAKAGMVKVQVFDMMGHTIESHSESMAAGSFAHTFGSMGKGAYIVRVQQGSMAKTIRMQVR